MASTEVVRFEDAFEDSAWGAPDAHQNEFEDAGAKALQNVQIVMKLGPELSSDASASKIMLANALKDVIRAHARVASDLLKSSEYDKQMVQVTATYAKQVGALSDKFVNHFANDNYVDALAKAIKYLNGKDPKKFLAVFEHYGGDADFQKNAAREFPPGLLSPGAKKKGLANSDVQPLIIAIQKISQQNNEAVSMYLYLTIALGYLLAHNVGRAYNWFDSAITSTLQTPTSK